MLDFKKWFPKFLLTNWLSLVIFTLGNWFIVLDTLHLKSWLKWVIYILVWGYSLWKLISYFSQIRNQLKLFKQVKQSPISMVIGPLGSGKTLFTTHLLINSVYDTKYSNYYVGNNNIAQCSFDMFDFNNYNVPLPYTDSNLVVLDEMALYLPANDYQSALVRSYSGVIPSLVLMRQFDINVIFVGQRENHHWVEYRDLATGLFIPLYCKQPPLMFKGMLKYFVWFLPFFKVSVGFFDDKDNYLIWKSKSVERAADGKKVKLKNSDSIGMRKFNFRISLLDAMKYDTKYLGFIRDIKNNQVLDKSLDYWDNFSFSTWDDVKKSGMRRLITELEKGCKK